MSLPEKFNITNSEPGIRVASPGSQSHGPTYGLLVTLTAKVGRQDQVAAILSNALSIAVRETGTITWYAYRITDTKFGIFNTFNNEEDRSTHLSGDIAATLTQVSDELLEQRPDIQALSIVTSKI